MDEQAPQTGETVQRILTAARDAFSDGGFNGTTVEEIARRAGVNKAALYYHIGDKETLYAEVIRRVIEQSVAGISRDLARARSPEEKLKRYLRGLAAAVDENPWMPRIMMRELAAGGVHFPDVALRAFARIFLLVGEILAEGVRKGVFVETTPFLLHMMVMGAFVFHKTTAPLRGRLSDLVAGGIGTEGTVAGPVAAEVERMVLRAVLRERPPREG